MTLGSIEKDGKKVYVLELTEEEFNNCTLAKEPIVKIVESSKGIGKFTLSYEQK